MARNPFPPTFGVSPPLLVGRSDLLDDFVGALEDGPGAPGRMTLYTGARGTGKTVMLNEVEDLASQQGWRVISENATEGLVNRLVREHLPALLSDIDPDGSKTKMTGVSAPMGLGGATWETSEALERTYSMRVQKMRLRRGSGGAGVARGGEGIEREIGVLEPCTVTLITERRVSQPWGLAGGGPGAVGENWSLPGGDEARAERLPE